MTTMPGNPFVEAVRVALDRDPDAPISDGAAATLALAHEVRTANMIAVATATFADGSAMFPAQIDSTRRQITDRLGVGGADE